MQRHNVSESLRGRHWTCWYWPVRLDDPETRDVPVPYSRSSDNLDELCAWAKGLTESGGVSWVRVFASADEYDERFRWEA